MVSTTDQITVQYPEQIPCSASCSDFVSASLYLHAGTHPIPKPDPILSQFSHKPYASPDPNRTLPPGQLQQHRRVQRRRPAGDAGRRDLRAGRQPGGLLRAALAAPLLAAAGRRVVAGWLGGRVRGDGRRGAGARGAGRAGPAHLPAVGGGGGGDDGAPQVARGAALLAPLAGAADRIRPRHLKGDGRRRGLVHQVQSPDEAPFETPTKP